ncbi:hypothetical protein Q7C36_012468 [Tachysurus vachellii]|uniref:Selenoprotein K n=1 Tax=Tachysurus vachellii TaxID=175792 RepID=A0AA88MLF6_TACVA|nr:hypothetical protein Q7C36_012468 [Tachysurus vachellii]
MVYVSNGQVLDSRTRSPWRLSFLSDLFWGVVEFICLFFQTLVKPDLSKDGNQSSLSRYSDGRGPPVLLQWAVDEEGKCLHFVAGIEGCAVSIHDRELLM